MKAIRFHEYGEPTEVLKFEDADLPSPKPSHVRVKVYAVGLNPADWAICRGFRKGDLPRGIGLDVAGTVDELGEGVTHVKVGDIVYGYGDFISYPSCGAAEYAVMSIFNKLPPGLDLMDAAAFPLVTETAYRCLKVIDAKPGKTLFIHGAGSMVGFAAVQMAIQSGLKVVASAGPTLTPQLEAFGATVTSYGEGEVERATELCKGVPDHVFDAGLVSDTILADMIQLAGGDPSKVTTVSNHGPQAESLKVKNCLRELCFYCWPEYAQLIAEGKFKIPIAKTFKPSDWRDAMDLSIKGRPGGKVMIQFCE